MPTKKIYCNSCGTGTNHNLKSDQAARFSRSVRNADGEKISEPSLSYVYRFWVCCGCDTAVMEMEIVYPANSGTSDVAYWPPRLEHRRRAKILVSSPVNVYAAYTQVISSYNDGHYLLAAIGIRAILKVIFHYLGLDENMTRKFQGNVSILRTRKVLKEPIVNALEKMVILGDHAAERLLEPTEEKMSLALDLLDDLLVSQFEAPYRLWRSAEKFQ